MIMKNKTKNNSISAKLLLAFFVGFLSIGLLFFADQAQAQTSGICFKPNVPIPGMSAIFSQNGATACAEGGYAITPDSIGIYISALYNYAARLAAIIAMFMVVFAAWQWMMAAGNSSKIENAKDTIQGALIGLALLFAGQLLLNNISSRLVSFDGLEIRKVGIENVSSAARECSLSTLLANTPCGSLISVPRPEGGEYSCLGNLCSGTGNNQLKCVYLTNSPASTDEISFMQYLDCPNNQSGPNVNCTCKTEEEIESLNSVIFP